MSNLQPWKQLSADCRPGDLVFWSTVSEKLNCGRLKEWDNGTAIVVMPDGTEKAVRCA